LLEPNKGIFTYQIAREMSSEEHIRVIAPVPIAQRVPFLDSFRKHKIQRDVPQREKFEGIEVDHPAYHAIPKLGVLHHFAMYRALRPIVKAIHDVWHIDAVTCHWIFPDGVAVRRICEELDVPVMLTPLGTDLNQYGDFPIRAGIIKRALRKSDRVSVKSREMYDRCLGLGVREERLALTPNGVDIATFNILDREQARVKLDIRDDSHVILFVGSLVPVKGIETLLRAFRLMVDKRERTSLKLYLIGTGYLEAPLRRLSMNLGLNDFVQFVGTVKHRDIVHWLNAADCLCLPSLSEGHPNVVMESLACGTPVVASAVGSIPDFITTASGRLTRPLDYGDLAVKLDQCLTATYDRKIIRAHVQDFSWKECARRYVSELSRLVEEKRMKAVRPSTEKEDA